MLHVQQLEAHEMLHADARDCAYVKPATNTRFSTWGGISSVLAATSFQVCSSEADACVAKLVLQVMTTWLAQALGQAGSIARYAIAGSWWNAFSGR